MQTVETLLRARFMNDKQVLKVSNTFAVLLETILLTLLCILFDLTERFCAPEFPALLFLETEGVLVANSFLFLENIFTPG